MKALLFVGLVALSGVPLTVFPGDGTEEEAKYYMVVFTYQGPGGRPREAHTFATFVRVENENEHSRKEVRLESHTISWLPANLRVALLRLRPEPGRNLGLEESLQLGAAAQADITAWGPYRIRKDLYDRAIAQVDRLKSGRLGYKAIDGGFRPGSATNCFHAISDIVDGPLLTTGPFYGETATEMVVAHLSGSIINRDEQHVWLIPRLGLDKFKISFRK